MNKNLRKIWTNKENGEKVSLNLVDSDKAEGIVNSKNNQRTLSLKTIF